MLPTRIGLGVLTLTTMILTMSVVSAQEYPARPVRILASEPGGGNDFIARIVAPPLSNALGQPVIIENRASRLVGPLGAIANPDGYTLIIAGGSFQYAPLMGKTDYDTVKSFEGVSQIERSYSVLVVNSALPVNSVKELIALAKAKPGALNYGSGGSGGTPHICAEMFKMTTGVNIVRVPYKSTGSSVGALLGQEVHLVFANANGSLPHVKSGKLRALAVTSPQPTVLVPGVPTMIAAGVPGFEMDSIGFVLAPLKTPAPIIKRLNQEIVRIMANPEVKAQFLAGGSEAITSTPEQIKAKLAADDAKMRKLFAAIGMRADQ